jgi:aminocarboxymuconate-semialdehyde decarboxylase
MYFDSLVLSTMALQHLVQAVGPKRVVIGTDYPMAMGDREPVGKIGALSQMTEEERSCILEKNALRALKRSE